MAQPVNRSLYDDAMRFFEARARQNGTTAQAELDRMESLGRPFTPEERVAVSRYIRSFTKPSRPLTLDEIREGLE